MGTIIKMSDGDTITVDSEFNGMVRVIADALESNVDPTDRDLPRGFIRVETREKAPVVLNAAQVNSIRPEVQEARPGLTMLV